MNRRGFLQSIAALPAIPVVAKLGFLDRLIPMVKREMYWKFVKFTGFKKYQGSCDVCGQIWGERSDGTFFYSNALLRADQSPWSEEYKRTKIKLAEIKFESFRTCECCLLYGEDITVSCDCVKHGGDGVVHREANDDRLERLRRESEADECEEKKLLTRFPRSA